MKRKPRPILERINITLWVLRERSYKLLENDIHLSVMIKDSKLYINKFIHNKGLIYLGARKFRKTKGYSIK